MRRYRWAFVLLGVAALVGVSGGATVSARSSAAYTNHAVSASSFTSTDHAAPAQDDWSWVSYGTAQKATWTFSDIDGLQFSTYNSVYLNFNALSAGPNWGSGWSTTIRVVVTGTGTGSFTATLANPWRPHIAFNETAGIGWNATAAVLVPKYIYAGAEALKVTVSVPNPGNHGGFNQDALLLGYATYS